MANEGKVHDFKGIGHRTLAQMATEVLRGKEPLRLEEKEASVITSATLTPKAEAKQNPTSQRKERGRILLFIPTGEKVTLIKENVGQSYDGTWISEVISREGKKFLASKKQLKNFV